MPTLDEYVHSEVVRRGWTYAELARRTGLPRSTVHKIATSRLRRTPEPRTLELLAAGLGVAVSDVQAAAAESLGYELTHDGAPDADLTVITASLARLSVAERRHVLALVTSLLDRDQAKLRD